jgi:molecular chaperone DnaK
MATDNEMLGEFVLDGLRPAPRGEVKVRITFAINADGIVKVSAEDVATGKAVNMLIEASSNLTEQEIKEIQFEDIGF